MLCCNNVAFIILVAIQGGSTQKHVGKFAVTRPEHVRANVDKLIHALMDKLLDWTFKPSLLLANPASTGVRQSSLRAIPSSAQGLHPRPVLSGFPRRRAALYSTLDWTEHRPRYNVERNSGRHQHVRLRALPGMVRSVPSLTLEAADAMSRVALQEAERLNCGPIAVAVVDATGDLVLSKRQDGGTSLLPVAVAKAQSCAHLKISTRKMRDEYPVRSTDIAPLAHIDKEQHPGGVVCFDGGNIIGAIGVAGASSDLDELCGLTAARAVGFVTEPVGGANLPLPSAVPLSHDSIGGNTVLSSVVERLARSVESLERSIEKQGKQGSSADIQAEDAGAPITSVASPARPRKVKKATLGKIVHNATDDFPGDFLSSIFGMIQNDMQNSSGEFSSKVIISDGSEMFELPIEDGDDMEMGEGKNPFMKMLEMSNGGPRSSKQFTPVNVTGVTFDDVKGCEEAKDEMKEVVLYLKDPERFTRLGARLPHGILMTGPPGTGKTLIARAVAGEANATFFQCSGSEFDEEFVGVGARRVRELFQEARRHTPSIVFIDELDAVGGKRNSRDMAVHRQTLNQLLVELDGFKQNEGLVLIGATNFPESLDKALTRAGRLDKTVVLPVPDLRGRQDILQLYAKNITLDSAVDLTALARRTTGMTGADLANILNIAAIRSSVDQLPAVSMAYLDEAFDRVVVGAARRSPMSKLEKNITAYHEGGHALVCLKTYGADPVHKATIVPRGSSLGITWNVPESEKFSHRLFELQARLDMIMGGRAAEALAFGQENVSAGCSSDLQQATELARRMVMQFGMGGGTERVLMYLDDLDHRALSDTAKHELDNRVHSLLSDAYTRALELLRRHVKELHLLADALMEYETLDAEDISLAISGKKEKIRERYRAKQNVTLVSLKHATPTVSPDSHSLPPQESAYRFSFVSTSPDPPRKEKVFSFVSTSPDPPRKEKVFSFVSTSPDPPRKENVHSSSSESKASNVMDIFASLLQNPSVNTRIINNTKEVFEEFQGVRGREFEHGGNFQVSLDDLEAADGALNQLKEVFGGKEFGKEGEVVKVVMEGPEDAERALKGIIDALQGDGDKKKKR